MQKPVIPGPRPVLPWAEIFLAFDATDLPRMLQATLSSSLLRVRVLYSVPFSDRKLAEAIHNPSRNQLRLGPKGVLRDFGRETDHQPFGDLFRRNCISRDW
jgi:hypothetical protein